MLLQRRAAVLSLALAPIVSRALGAADRPIARGFIPTSAGRLHMRRVGRGKPVVLMQVLPFSTAMFENLMGVLADRYDCIAIDLLGYAESDARKAPLSVEGHAALMVEALEVLGIKEWAILGGHFTAQVATAVALNHAAATKAVILDGVPLRPEGAAAAKPPPVPPPTPPTNTPADAVARNWGYARDLIKRLNPEMAVTSANQTIFDAAALAYVRNASLGGPGLAVPDPFDIAAALPRLSVPTLIVGSATDNNRVYHDRAVAMVNGASQHIFDGINPLYQFDRPDRAGEYALALTGFFGRIAY